MKDNYKAWDIKISDFNNQKTEAERIKFLLNFAILAPSSHNSQPWAFKIEQNSILVFPAQNRRLKQSDTNDRQLYISLGCAIENIVIAADYYGYKATISYLPTSEQAAKIILEKTHTKTDQNHLIFSIPKRTNNRNKYERKSIEQSFLEKIQNLSDESIGIKIISEATMKNNIADIALIAMSEAMESKTFRNELSQYIKSNVTKSSTGMPGFGMGFPTLLSLIAPSMLRAFNMSKATRKQDEKLLKKFTPSFGIISTLGDSPESWMKAGRAFEQIALLAEQSHIKTAVWAAPIQIGSYYKKVQALINTNLRPQVFFRMGYTNKETPHSPRLTVDQVI